MTSLPRSAFDLLDDPIRRWIWQQKWPALRDVQEKSIPAILGGGDVVVSAKTAAGKTEAAMLPLISRIRAAGHNEKPGFAILYVSPLKALINDQFRRLQGMCEACDVMLHKWHGDVSADAKARARKRPTGVVLITPESLEALLIRRGGEIPFLFSALNAVVIDELHAFIGSERGMQLQSILARIEVATKRHHIDRIGLSATLGDMGLAAEALRPGNGSGVTIIQGMDPGNGVKLQIRGYLENSGELKPEDSDGAVAILDESSSPKDEFGIPDAVVDDLFAYTRGKRNLLFAGSRQKVELYTDRLRRACTDSRVPNEYFAHHGSLSKTEREDVELRLKEDARPTTAVATTTLELGIDIGDVETVAQIGPGFSVASLRQRLGRSGRRPGKPAILRVFAIEPFPQKGGHPLDRLNLGLVQSIAMVECLKCGWCEPPAKAGLHLSTLIHQTMALILQTGGIRPAAAWTVLCSQGPFKAVDKKLFADLLRCMASPENKLIEQGPDGALMIGAYGEPITASHEFYPVFATEREYRMVFDSKALGTYPLNSPIARGETIIFAGRRWKVLEIDDRARVITVKPTRAGMPPYFAGEGGAIHDQIVVTMRDILNSQESFGYLDSNAAEMLEAARSAFRDLKLDVKSIIAHGDGALIFPWLGTKKVRTLTLALLAKNFEATQFGHSIEMQSCDVDGVRSCLAEMAEGNVPDENAIAERLAKPFIARFDDKLSPDLMMLVTLTERVEVAALPTISATVAGEGRMI
jgi:ATP-dependent Lhr-like helicase